VSPLNCDGLTPGKLEVVCEVVEALKVPIRTTIPAGSPISEVMGERFANLLLLHRWLTDTPFTKEKFEYALVDIFKRAGFEAALADPGNPGHDVTLNGTRASCKTQANKAINADYVHISKFMELGKGEWTDQLAHLAEQRERFLAHLERYDVIYVLRHVTGRYELLQYDPVILKLAADAELEMVSKTKQTVKPGYCRVYRDGILLYELYFDGGGERKLQIKKLRRDLGTVLAEWDFNV
jgi:type II restriction enzyme